MPIIMPTLKTAQPEQFTLHRTLYKRLHIHQDAIMVLNSFPAEQLITKA